MLLRTRVDLRKLNKEVELAGECVRRGYSRLSWAVLDWNTDAIALYDAVGGRPMSEWIGYRVSGSALSALAES